VEPSSDCGLGWELVFPAGPFSYQWPLGREYFLGCFDVQRDPGDTVRDDHARHNAVFEE
jgi:hypothetical protein